MNKDEKKKLKKFGKDLVENQSREFREALSKTNPAEFGSRQHLRNEIEIRKREKHIRITPEIRKLDEAEKIIFFSLSIKARHKKQSAQICIGFAKSASF